MVWNQCTFLVRLTAKYLLRCREVDDAGSLARLILSEAVHEEDCSHW